MNVVPPKLLNEGAGFAVKLPVGQGSSRLSNGTVIRATCDLLTDELVNSTQAGILIQS